MTAIEVDFWVKDGSECTTELIKINQSENRYIDWKDFA